VIGALRLAPLDWRQRRRHLIKSGSSDFNPVETASVLLDYDDANVQQQHYTNDHSTEKRRKTKVVMRCTRRHDPKEHTTKILLSNKCHSTATFSPMDHS
jgi:hypothetical protein